MKWNDRTPEDRAAVNKKRDAVWARNGYTYKGKIKILTIIKLLSIGFFFGVLITIYVT